jgi:hypothetical protein
MRSTIIAMALVSAGIVASAADNPAAAQQESCLNEIQRLEAAFADAGRGSSAPDGEMAGSAMADADRTQSRAASRDTVSKDIERSDGVVAPAPIGSGIRTEQPVRGIDPVPMSKNPGQQPGGLAGARLSPQQTDDMTSMLREGRAAAERGDSGACMDKVRQARQLARGATTGVRGGG